MHKITISAIVPTYNRKTSIINAIESVLKQTHAVDEIIVVDDGSKDGTREVIKKTYSKEIIYIYQANRGGAGALNTGLKAASGNWIAIMDSDDHWKENKIEKQVYLLCKYKSIDFIHTNRTHHWEGGRTESRKENSIADFTNKEFLLTHWATKQSTVLFRKDLVKRVGGLFCEDLRTCYDYEYFWKLILSARQIGYLPESLVDITLSADGLSRTDSRISRIYDNINAMNSVINWIGCKRFEIDRYKYILAKRIIAEIKTIVKLRVEEKSQIEILKDFVFLGKHASGIAKKTIAKELFRKIKKYRRNQ